MLFPPTIIPVDNKGKITHGSELRAYVVLVVVEPSREVMLFEFDRPIFDALAGYASRRQNIYDVELLLSREETGILRITSGRANNSTIDDLISEFASYNQGLPDRYRSMLGNEVFI